MSQRAKQDTAQAGHAGQPGLVAFVGTGPGSTELLTVRAAALLGHADLVVGRAVGQRAGAPTCCRTAPTSATRPTWTATRTC